MQGIIISRTRRKGKQIIGCDEALDLSRFARLKLCIGAVHQAHQALLVLLPLAGFRALVARGAFGIAASRPSLS